jgi:hypothetical protein
LEDYEQLGFGRNQYLDNQEDIYPFHIGRSRDIQDNYDLHEMYPFIRGRSENHVSVRGARGMPMEKQFHHSFFILMILGAYHALGVQMNDTCYIALVVLILAPVVIVLTKYD